MDMYKNILVIANPLQDHQPALIRAIDIANRESIAKITVFMTIFDFSYEMTSMLSAAERNAMRQGMIKQRAKWLEDICEPYKKEGFGIDIIVKWHNRPYEAILKHIVNHKIDLVIKAARQHDKLESIFFTPTDWHILRKSPCPVLMVRDNAFPENASAIVALDLSSDTNPDLSFNDHLIKQAQEVVELMGGKLNLVNAYPATPANITVELPEFNPSAYTEAIRKHHINSMQELCVKYNIDEKHAFVEQGLPDEIIPELASKLKAEIVVMGTQGRTGISAAFIGNTAETIIDKLNCDLLAIKPKDYICPIDKD